MRFLERLNSPVVFVIALAVFLILDGLLLYRYQQTLQSTAGSASDTPVEETSALPEAASVATTPAEETTTSSRRARANRGEETTSSPERTSGVRVLVGVSNVGVGLTILEDGRLVYDQVANPGFSEEFQAEESITVTAADAGPVRVGVNGGAQRPLGANGEQVTRTFTPED